MDWSNIWKHPRTSTAGLLLGVVTVAGVLSQQGITLGTAGTGTVVALISGICTALLGLLARDPVTSSTSSDSNSSASKLGALALCAILITGTLPVMGCSASSESQLRADGTVLVTALDNLASVVQTSDATTASDILTAASAIQSAVSSNQTGTAWMDVVNAASAAAESILAKIPSTSKYASLVAIAVAAAETIVAATATNSTKLMRADATGNSLIEYSRYGHALVHHRIGRSASGDFRAAWNNEAQRLGYLPAVVK